jgi:diguanylate cyclase (GGDEF)-like protein
MPPMTSRPEAGPSAQRGRRDWIPAGRAMAPLYAAAGLLMGLGAPAGALLFRVLGGASAATELREHAFFYAYELLSTCTVFGVAGFAAGRRNDRLRSGRDRFRELAERDPLTGLLNVATFRRLYERAAAHAASHGEPLSVLVMDVDGLKEINDTLGHSFGTAALLHAARALERSKRISDVAARWGGDEFALLMPGAREEAASRLSEEILAQLRAEPVRADGRERGVSVTIGIAGCVGEPREDLFDLADRALYAAKRAGKARIAVAS